MRWVLKEGVAPGFGSQAEGVNAVPESQFVVLSPGVQVGLEAEGVVKRGGKGGGLPGLGVRLVDLVQVNNQQGGNRLGYVGVS